MVELSVRVPPVKLSPEPPLILRVEGPVKEPPAIVKELKVLVTALDVVTPVYVEAKVTAFTVTPVSIVLLQFVQVLLNVRVSAEPSTPFGLQLPVVLQLESAPSPVQVRAVPQTGIDNRMSRINLTGTKVLPGLL